MVFSLSELDMTSFENKCKLYLSYWNLDLERTNGLEHQLYKQQFMSLLKTVHGGHMESL